MVGEFRWQGVLFGEIVNDSKKWLELSLNFFEKVIKTKLEKKKIL